MAPSAPRTENRLGASAGGQMTEERDAGWHRLRAAGRGELRSGI